MSGDVVLIATRGLPGAGKTTWAVAWVAAGAGRVRQNRDSLRTMMFGGETGLDEHERAVTIAQHTAVAALLARGWSVVVDDTNMAGSAVDALRALADAAGARFEVYDLRAVPVSVCIARDAQRGARDGHWVGGGVIEDMAERYREEIEQIAHPGDGDDDRQSV